MEYFGVTRLLDACFISHDLTYGGHDKEYPNTPNVCLIYHLLAPITQNSDCVSAKERLADERPGVQNL